MRPVLNRGMPPIHRLEPYFIYAQRFDVVPQLTSSSRWAACPERSTGMFVLKRATRANGSRIGGIVALSCLRAPAPLLPRFVGGNADPRLTMHNCLDYSSEAWLNKYHEKDLFYTLTLASSG
jgi:hypothetical protein